MGDQLTKDRLAEEGIGNRAAVNAMATTYFVLGIWIPTFRVSGAVLFGVFAIINGIEWRRLRHARLWVRRDEVEEQP